MRYLSEGLFNQNKFAVKFICPNMFFTWLLVFYHLIDAFVLVVFTSSTSHSHPLCRSSRSQMFFKIGVLKNFANFTGKQDVFLWNLRNFYKHFYLQNTSSGCFCKASYLLYVRNSLALAVTPSTEDCFPMANQPNPINSIDKQCIRT